VRESPTRSLKNVWKARSVFFSAFFFFNFAFSISDSAEATVEPSADPVPEDDVDSIINDLMEENDARAAEDPTTTTTSAAQNNAPAPTSSHSSAKPSNVSTTQPMVQAQHHHQNRNNDTTQRQAQEPAVDVDSLVDEMMVADVEDEEPEVLRRKTRLDLSTRLPMATNATNSHDAINQNNSPNPTHLPNPAPRPVLQASQPQPSQQQLPPPQQQPSHPSQQPHQFHHGRAEPRQHVQVREVEVKELKRMSGERRKQGLATKHQQMLLQQHQAQQQQARERAHEGAVPPRGGQMQSHPSNLQQQPPQLPTSNPNPNPNPNPNAPKPLPARKPLPNSPSQYNVIAPQNANNNTLQQQPQIQVQNHLPSANPLRDCRSKSTGLVHEQQHVQLLQQQHQQQQQQNGQTRPLSKSGTGRMPLPAPRQAEMKPSPTQQPSQAPHSQEKPQITHQPNPMMNNTANPNHPQQQPTHQQRQPSPQSNPNPQQQRQHIARPPSGGIPNGKLVAPTQPQRPISSGSNAFPTPSGQQQNHSHSPMLVHAQSQPVLMREQSGNNNIVQSQQQPPQQQPQPSPIPTIQAQSTTTKYILEPPPLSPQLLGSPRGANGGPVLPSRAIQMQPGQSLADYLAQQSMGGVGGTVSARVVSPRQANPLGPSSSIGQQPTTTTTQQQANPNSNPNPSSNPSSNAQKQAIESNVSPRGPTSPRTASGTLARNYVLKQSTENFNNNNNNNSSSSNNAGSPMNFHHQPSLPQQPSPVSVQVIHRPHTWDKHRVQQWLIEVDFAEFSANLKYTDGKALLTLVKSEMLEMGIPLQAAIPLLAQIEDLKVQTAGANYGNNNNVAQSTSAKVKTPTTPIPMHVPGQGQARPGSVPLINQQGRAQMYALSSFLLSSFFLPLLLFLLILVFFLLSNYSDL
jgi:hypothetical protein